MLVHIPAAILKSGDFRFLGTRLHISYTTPHLLLAERVTMHCNTNFFLDSASYIFTIYICGYEGMLKLIIDMDNTTFSGQKSCVKISIPVEPMQSIFNTTWSLKELTEILCKCTNKPLKTD